MTASSTLEEHHYIDETELETIINREHSDEHTSSVLTGLALGLDAAKSLLLMGAAINNNKALYGTWQEQAMEIYNQEHPNSMLGFS